MGEGVILLSEEQIFITRIVRFLFLLIFVFFSLNICFKKVDNDRSIAFSARNTFYHDYVLDVQENEVISKSTLIFEK